MHSPTRRGFLQSATLGSLLCRFTAGGQDLLRAQQGPAPPRYDLVIKGGRVIDPAQSLSGVRDVAIAGRRIARVAAGIPENEARAVLDARGKIVTPGLIDVHVHVYEGGAAGHPGRSELHR
jgi:dihydroorotase